jgi:hypothetical protein
MTSGASNLGISMTRERGQVPTGPAWTELNKPTMLYPHTDTVVSYEIIGDRNIKNC